MEKGKTHIEYDDFGAYEEYLDEAAYGTAQDTELCTIIRQNVRINKE